MLLGQIFRKAYGRWNIGSDASDTKHKHKYGKLIEH